MSQAKFDAVCASSVASSKPPSFLFFALNFLIGLLIFDRFRTSLTERLYVQRNYKPLTVRAAKRLHRPPIKRVFHFFARSVLRLDPHATTLAL